MVHVCGVCVCVCRDDLYRVELDHVSGDEMFYSKVSPCPALCLLHTHNCMFEHFAYPPMDVGDDFIPLSFCRKGRGNPIRMTSASVE